MIFYYTVIYICFIDIVFRIMLCRPMRKTLPYQWSSIGSLITFCSVELMSNQWEFERMLAKEWIINSNEWQFLRYIKPNKWREFVCSEKFFRFSQISQIFSQNIRNKIITFFNWMQKSHNKIITSLLNFKY